MVRFERLLSEMLLMKAKTSESYSLKIVVEAVRKFEYINFRKSKSRQNTSAS